MARWLSRLLKRIRALSLAHRVRFTHKAYAELAQLGLGLDPFDALHVLSHLEPSDYAGREVSDLTGEWMYVFTPEIGEMTLYLKVILRAECVVISFHEQGEEDDG